MALSLGEMIPGLRNLSPRVISAEFWMDAAEPELLRRELWSEYQFSVSLVTHLFRQDMRPVA